MKKLFIVADRFQRKLAADEMPPTEPPSALSVPMSAIEDDDGPATEREPGGSAAWQQEGKPLVIAKSLFQKARLELQKFRVLLPFVSGMAAASDEDSDEQGTYSPEDIRQMVESWGYGRIDNESLGNLQAVIDELEELEQGVEGGKTILKLL